MQSTWHTTLDRQLQELTLIQCSLLPGERFTFNLPPSDLALWQSLLDNHSDSSRSLSVASESLADPPCPARFEIHIQGANVWFQVDLPSCTTLPLPLPLPLPNRDASLPVRTATPLAHTSICVKGENLSRDEQEHWNALVREHMAQIDDHDACEFPIYELLTLLLPPLHDQQSSASYLPASPPSAHVPQTDYHALLTSHHLISTTKRRLMRQWSHDLNIAGFAKIGYPGVIYAEGPQEAVEEFVGNVKGMQWLALRVRFQEPVPNRLSVDEVSRNERWVEVSKIGEVLEQMRKRGREVLVTSLGIGAPSKESK